MPSVITPCGGSSSSGGGFALPGHRLGATEDRWYMAAQMTVGAPGTNLSVVGRYAWPFIPTRDMTLDALSAYVTSAIAASTIRLGIYDDDGNIYPDALLYGSGAITTATTGAKTQTVSVALTAATLYWFVIHFSHANVQCRSASVSSCIPILGWSGPVPAPTIGFGWENAGLAIAALPDPYPAGATVQDSASGIFPCIMVRGT